MRTELMFPERFPELLAVLRYRSLLGTATHPELTSHESELLRHGLRASLDDSDRFDALFEFYCLDAAADADSPGLPAGLRDRFLETALGDLQPGELVQLATSPVWMAELRELVVARQSGLDHHTGPPRRQGGGRDGQPHDDGHEHESGAPHTLQSPPTEPDLAVPAGPPGRRPARTSRRLRFAGLAACLAAGVVVALAVALQGGRGGSASTSRDPGGPYASRVDAWGDDFRSPSGVHGASNGPAYTGWNYSVAPRVTTRRRFGWLYQVDKHGAYRLDKRLGEQAVSKDLSYEGTLAGPHGFEYFVVILADSDHAFLDAASPAWLSEEHLQKLQSLGQRPGEPKGSPDAAAVVTDALRRAGWEGRADDVHVRLFLHQRK